MKRDLQLSILRELKRQIDVGRNIDAGVQYRMPTDVYVCPEIAAQEWEVLFRNHAQVIGLSCDLPEPGSFLTVEEFGTPVLATRDKNGHFRAFVNACRHRGAQVTQAERGRKTVFTCPFHLWSYASSGELRVVTDEQDFGELDKSCNGLVELPAEECAGMLWVHPQPGGELNPRELLGEALFSELSDHVLDDHGFGANKTITMDLNWKLANDTFGETYHFAKLHRNTLGQIFKGNNLHLEEFGRNHRFTTASNGIAELADHPESEWDFWASTAFVLYYIFPNTTLVVGGDGANLLRFYPDPTNPGRSTTQVAVYAPNALIAADRAASEQAGDAASDSQAVYDADGANLGSIAANLEIFTSTVEFEDYVMGEMQQKSAASGALPEIIFGRNEPPLHHFHSSFRDALGLPPLEPISPATEGAGQP